MNGQGNEFEQFAEMRRAAERKAALLPENLKAMSPEETQHVVHELQVHQIQLEMQNENLRLAYAELEAMRARYFDLYDMAPVGYFTLSKEGMILETNLTAATMLDVLRDSLVNRPVSQFIFNEDQDIYYLHRGQLFQTGEPQACELRMVKKDGEPCWVHLQASAAQDADGKPVCRVVMIDFSERKRMENRIAGQMNNLEIHNSCMVGRETRMIELKKEINAMLKAAGKLQKYESFPVE